MAWAPDNDKGEHPYVRTAYSVTHGRDVADIVYAPNLKTAKARHGQHNTWHPAKLRRAKPEDMPQRPA